MSRRAAVRRAATVVGLSAGAVALPGLTGTSSADPGDPVIAGGKTAAGDNQTNLQSSGTMPTLRLENTRSRSGPVADQVDLIAPQLQLSGPVPSTSRPQVPDLRNLPAGAVAASGGMMFLAADLGGQDVVPVQVQTSLFGNFFQPLTAARSAVLDTATMPADARAALPSGTFDGAGRLAAGARLMLDLRALVDTSRIPGLAAAVVSLSVSGADAEGEIHSHDGAETEAGATVLAYGVVPAAPGGAPYPIPATAGAVLGLDTDDRLWLSATSSTHLRVHVTGLMLPDPACLAETPDDAGALTGIARRQALQRQAVRELMDGITLPE